MLLARYAGRAFPRSSLDGPDRLRREVPARGSARLVLPILPAVPTRGRCLAVALAARLERRLRAPPRAARRRCPQCGAVAGIGRASGWPRDRQGRLSDPARCPHARQRKLCRARTRDGPDTDQCRRATLLSAQRSINALLDDEVQPTLAGDAAGSAAEYLRDLRVLANMPLHPPATRGKRETLSAKLSAGAGRAASARRRPARSARAG